MKDKIQEIRETVENRYEYWKEKESNSHSIESEIRMSECKHLLLMLDSLQEEPVSEDLEKIVEEIAEPTILNAYGTKELARRLRNTIYGTSVSENLEKASKEWLSQQLDKSYAAYGETKQMELTHFDGYAMLDAIEFGANWQKQQDQSTIELAEDHAMLAGMEKMKEEMMTKSIEAVISQVPCSNEIIFYNPSSVYRYCLPQEMNKLGLNKGDKVKLVIIKED